MPPEASGDAGGPWALGLDAMAPLTLRSSNPERCTMRITNPFIDNAPTDLEDRALVARARSGDRKALEDLVQRHQAWIYNIAVRMLYHPQDAEDATQEILIKVLTRLSSFEGRSSFRTWLYRIVVNHVLNMKRGRVEHASTDFASYGAALDDTPALELADPKGTSADTDLLVTEAMISCTSGMLLCLDREQRLTFILGAIFGEATPLPLRCWRSLPTTFANAWPVRGETCATS
jgi:RNA polymerase sigma factor (sigma-70 family)